LSSFHTHMLIGAAGGLAVYELVERFAPAILPAQFSILGADIPIPPVAIGAACVVASSVSALWPDIDKPDSFISHAATHLMWLAGGLAGLLFGLQLGKGFIAIVVGVVLGGIAGVFVGAPPIMTILRVATGGHRRLTHSLLVGGGLFFGAWVLYLLHWDAVSLLALILAWGQILHLAGDVVTPGGVALFFPIWPGDIHIFPFWLAAIGEPAVAILSVMVGAFFIWVWGSV
jgi:membrane-bound metal-dependent hydrolase YbcI (DUF457 family)